MIIKKPNKVNYFKLLLDPIRRVYKRSSSLLIINLIIIISIPIILFEFAPMWGVYQKAKVVIINGPSVIKNYLSSINVNAEKFEISIKDKHLKKLNYIKEMSYDHYEGIDNLDEASMLRQEWLPAQITHEGRT